MNPQRYALIVAIVFAAIAVLQLARAVLGWPVAVTTPWGTAGAAAAAGLFAVPKVGQGDSRRLSRCPRNARIRAPHAEAASIRE
jgi:hypothetical protein